MIITLADYWMGRDKTHASELTPEIIANATETVKRANLLLPHLMAAGVTLDLHPNGTLVSSGWRPAAINAGVPNAAARSKHMTGQAVDIYDPDGDIDDWLMTSAGIAAMSQIGIWLEHPSCTKNWSHWGITAPRSGKRIFFP